MRVVIVGGGFGGVRATLSLANKNGTEVKLLSSQSYFEYHAALYRSATGRSPLEVAIPLREFFTYAKNVEVVEDKITDIDETRQVITGDSGSNYQYDALILALGNITEYYGIEGMKEYSYGVKTIHEALRLKRHLHEQIINSETDRNYVVVGAGATGVELAAELQAYLKKIRSRHKIDRKFTVNLIEAGLRPLAAMPEDFSMAIAKRLKKLKVKAYYNTPVKSETVDEIQLPNGPIKTQTVVWTAGVANNPFFLKFPSLFKLGKIGRVEVDEFLRARPNIYIIGDSAATRYSGMAQTALHDAVFVTKNLLRELKQKQPKAYVPKRPVYAIPVGSRWAAILWGNARIYGRFGWALRRFADLKLYLIFLTPRKALTTWRYGFVNEEVCPICK